MTNEEIARIINPEYPWVYAPTTAPTKLFMFDGSTKVGYFQFTRSSSDLEKLNKFTFVEFGENANYYRATGDEKYVTIIEGDKLVDVEYPSYNAHEVSLKLIVDQFDSLKKQLDKIVLSTDKLIFLVSNYQLDWGISEPENLSEDYTAGATKQILLEGLSDQTTVKKRSFTPNNNKIISLLEQFINENDLKKEMITDLYKLVFKKNGVLRKFEATAHKRKPSDFVFVHPKHIEEEFEKLMIWYKRQSHDVTSFHPLFLAAIFHYRFVCIHPFEDGNGRIARIMTSLILLRNRIPPPMIRLEQRVIYIDSLQKADDGDLEAWIEFLGKKIIISIERILTSA